MIGATPLCQSGWHLTFQYYGRSRRGAGNLKKNRKQCPSEIGIFIWSKSSSNPNRSWKNKTKFGNFGFDFNFHFEFSFFSFSFLICFLFSWRRRCRDRLFRRHCHRCRGFVLFLFVLFFNLPNVKHHAMLFDRNRAHKYSSGCLMNKVISMPLCQKLGQFSAPAFSRAPGPSQNKKNINLSLRD